MNWKTLNKELKTVYGNKSFRFYNDKNKYTRRIKILGPNKYKIKAYLNAKYPNMTIWESTGSVNYYNGICFNMEH
jgi:hypothetical protein